MPRPWEIDISILNQQVAPDNWHFKPASSPFSSIMCTAPRYSQLHFRSVISLQSPSSQVDLPEKEKQTQKFREDPFSYWVSHSRTW